MINAFGIVYSSVAGNHQVTRDASLMKRLQPGPAAQGGVQAVQLAKRGIRGAQHVFEGADGFFRVYLHNKVDLAIARADLGTRFELLNLSYKPYPCCRDTHSTIDAIFELRARAPRPAEDIEWIKVGVTGPGNQMVCVPEQVRLNPRTIVEAQFSIPYNAAVAWIDGRMGLPHFTNEGIQRADVLALTRRVQPFVDADIDRDWSRYVTPARVIVRFRDGTEIETRLDYPKGHPRNMMTRAEFEAKSADCATITVRPMPPDTAHRLAEVTSGLERVADIAELMRVMCPA